jgi:hypothetical protein
MRKRVLATIGVAGLLTVMASGPASAQPDCSWGELTRSVVPLGAHASDPSGDGKGPGDADQPRVGLANVVERGNLHATCEALAGLVG